MVRYEMCGIEVLCVTAQMKCFEKCTCAVFRILKKRLRYVRKKAYED